MKVEKEVIELKMQNKYDEIINIAESLNIDECDSSEMAHIFGKAYEKQKCIDKSVDWFLKSYELDTCDQKLGMLIGVSLAAKKYDFLQSKLEKIERNSNEKGFYFLAGKYQLIYRNNLQIDQEIEALEEFLRYYSEVSYMIRLAILYVNANREKDATKVCKKISRLYMSGDEVDYANGLLESIKARNAKEFIQKNKYVNDNIFKYLSFTNESSEANYYVEYKKKNNITTNINNSHKNRELLPIIENSFSNIIGMKDIKKLLDNYVNIVDISKKRDNVDRILKDNFKIVGNNGSGKTIVAYAVTNILKEKKIIDYREPIIFKFESVIAGNIDQIKKNIILYLQQCEGKCLLIENINEISQSDELFILDLFISLYRDINCSVPLIITGDQSTMNKMENDNKTFKDIFNYPTLYINDYSKEDLLEIAKIIAEKKLLYIDKTAENKLGNKLYKLSKQDNFEYSRDINMIINEAYIRLNSRIVQNSNVNDEDLYVLKAEDFGDDESMDSLESLLEELNSLIGLKGVKEQVNQIINLASINKEKEELGIHSGSNYGSLNLVFVGNAGTGKTTVARIIGKIYKCLGVLPKGHLVECDRSNLVAEYVGHTALKTKEKINEAMGGVLFIDEAYTLAKGGENDFGKEAIDTLVPYMENCRDNLMVIMAGYRDDMKEFMKQNQGIKSRISQIIDFEDYTIEEMVNIFKKYLKNQGLLLEYNLEEKLYNLFEIKSKEKDFGNARGVRNVFEKICTNQSNRLSGIDRSLISKNDYLLIKEEDLGMELEEDAIEKCLKELESLTGLRSVKEKVNSVISTVQVNKKYQEMGIGSQGYGTLHMVFKGNAGTGKTTVARIMGKIYKELGVLSSGHVVECDRSSLVAGYIGQTALKTKEKIEEAIGGILFIDEAYALSKGGENDFGQEAIDTLVADMENNRDNLMVIVAGYSSDMEEFLKKNQGLKSRFPNELIFEDYTADEMYEIFVSMSKSKGLIIPEELNIKVRELLVQKSKERNFGNARGIRNVVEKIVEEKNNRIGKQISQGINLTKEEMMQIKEEDLGKLK